MQPTAHSYCTFMTVLKCTIVRKKQLLQILTMDIGVISILKKHIFGLPLNAVMMFAASDFVNLIGHILIGKCTRNQLSDTFNAKSIKVMVLILDGSSEIGAHVLS